MKLAVAPPAAPVAVPMPAEADDAHARKMRSLEEVRADLARLRANAKERHAQLKAQAQAEAQARRDIGFTHTDFLDFAPAKAAPAPKDNRDTGAAPFAPTDFFDLPGPNPEPAQEATTESSDAPTAFFAPVSLKAEPAPKDGSESSFAKTAFCAPTSLKLVR
ncbi:hypothetical protein [Variovorax defluvii]|uniref:hypothetical protein n=1 Tax=Variovorax defluvii TaxID=913761 RepID=UPI0031EE9A69